MTNDVLTISVKSTLRNFGFSFNIFISNNYFEIQKIFFGIKCSAIKLNYESYVYYEKDSYFYLKTPTNTVRVIYEADLDGDYLRVIDDKTNLVINISSNEYAEKVFRQLLNRLTK